jgi:hypothetical protein
MGGEPNDPRLGERSDIERTGGNRFLQLHR